MPPPIPATERAERVRRGARLRQIREQRGMSPAQLAAHLDVSRPYLARIELGQKPLSLAHREAAAAALEVEPDAFEPIDEGPQDTDAPARVDVVMFTTAQVGDLLHMSPDEVRLLIRRGDLEAVRKGGVYLVSGDAIRQYVASLAHAA